MAKPVFFNPAKKGEIHELQEELDSTSNTTKKEALKRIIAAMTNGKDVSMLFPNVVKCIQTQDLELKKLVYLYVMNYAKTQPDKALLAVNTFVQDSTKNPNPLVRALAIRTMGCIRLEKISLYLCDPLQVCLKDADPYVRKTAAVCVAKLYDISPDLVETRGFLDMLVELLSDSNPMVVSNSVAALTEIEEMAKAPVFEITGSTLNKLLAALNECSEWGQIYILNALARYTPKDSRECMSVAERVTARLQHQNSAVVLGAIRILMNYLGYIDSPEVVRTLSKKMSAPLVTLLSKEPELQYVALRNINLILQKRPNVLQYEMKVFFCKYNDPIYVKMEKLEIMIMLASERNIDQVLLEFKEYATAADVEFVRKAVRAIGRCAIKLENAAERCIHVLLELIQNGFELVQNGFNPVVQEAIIVIKDIFRKYPNQYESIIGKLCENLDTLDEPEARASMIWIIGEYAERIDNADELLDGFLESFLDEPVDVQMQLVTATVKLFLKRPKNTKDMVLRVLELATTECENPDLRDRGFFYWRLLTNPQSAKSVVFAERPLIQDDLIRMEDELLDKLVNNIGLLSSVYHKPPDAFVARGRTRGLDERPKELEERDSESLVQSEISTPPPVQETADALLSLDLGLGAPVPQPTHPIAASKPPQSPQPLQTDLLGGSLDLLSAPTPAIQQSARDPFHNAAVKESPLLLPPERGDGMQVNGEFAKNSEGQLVFNVTIKNLSVIPLSGFGIQFNKNTFGLAPAGPLLVPHPVQPTTSVDASVPLQIGSTQLTATGSSPSLNIQMAIKNNVKVYYFQAEVPFHLLFANDGRLDKTKYIQLWKSVPDTNEVTSEIGGVSIEDATVAQTILEKNNIFFIACRKVQDVDVLYCSVRTLTNIVILVELTFSPGSHVVKCCVKTNQVDIAPLFERSITSLLS